MAPSGAEQGHRMGAIRALPWCGRLPDVMVGSNGSRSSVDPILQPKTMDSATSIVMEVRKRRLQNTVAVVASLQLLLALKRRKRFSRKATIERPLRQDVTFTNICSVYTDSMFRTAFHMSRKVF